MICAKEAENENVASQSPRKVTTTALTFVKALRGLESWRQWRDRYRVSGLLWVSRLNRRRKRKRRFRHRAVV